MAEAHLRIDEGVKRGPRVKPAKLPKLKLKPSQVENEQRQEARRMHQEGTGLMVSLYTPEHRQKAVTDALASLESGVTVADVARLHGIAPSTLHSWLIADNRSSEARTLYYARQIANAIERLDSADTPLELARGRELHRAWITTAAVRDHHNFGNKQELTVKTEEKIELILDGEASDLLRELKARTVSNPTPCIAASPNTPLILDQSDTSD